MIGNQIPFGVCGRIMQFHGWVSSVSILMLNSYNCGTTQFRYYGLQEATDFYGWRLYGSAFFFCGLTDRSEQMQKLSG